MNKRQELLDALKDDPFNLLDEKKRRVPEARVNDPLVAGFEEINDFYEANGNEPKSNMSNILEFQLYSRLKSIREDSAKVKTLKIYDRFKLLESENIREMTLEDVFADDDMDILSTDIDDSIFRLRHVKPVERIKPDYLARRKSCKDFSEYADMFSAIHNELEQKKRRLVPYKTEHLMPETFFVLNGIVLYLQAIDGCNSLYNFASGDRMRYDGRTRCIFDNGTESDMLYRSLDKAMQIDGYSISQMVDDSIPATIENVEDKFNGYIYVLRSRNPKVKTLKNLYKIGYTSGTVAERIKNAKKEATYLFDDVDVVSTFRCLNLNSYDLEQTIHNFFADVRLDIKLCDFDGNMYTPKEWFCVPIDIIEEVIKLIVANKISNYTYDAKSDSLLRKNIR